MEETVKTAGEQLKPYRFKPGESGNPAGRPKGSISIKDMVRKHLEDNPEDLKEFVSHFIKKNRELAWQMMEGRPSQGIGQADDLKPLPIYAGLSVPKYPSDQKDILPDQED